MYSGAPELVADAPDAAPVHTVHPADHRAGKWRRPCVVKIEKAEEAGGSLPYRPEAGEGGLSCGWTAGLSSVQHEDSMQPPDEHSWISVCDGEGDHHDRASPHLSIYHGSRSAVRDFSSHDHEPLELFPPLRRQQARAGSTLAAYLDQ